MSRRNIVKSGLSANITLAPLVPSQPSISELALPMPPNNPIPHVNLGGYAGAGKTTISSLLAKKYNTLWIPRITFRPIRRMEVPGREYIFVTEEEFNCRLEKGEILNDFPGLIRQVSNTPFSTGILHPDFWPKPTPDTELMLSVFGSMSNYVKIIYAPEMINLFLSIRDPEELRWRIKERSRKHKVAFFERQRTNVWYHTWRIEKKFDRVIYNDDRDNPEKCVAEIEKVARLTRRMVV